MYVIGHVCDYFRVEKGFQVAQERDYPRQGKHRNCFTLIAQNLHRNQLRSQESLSSCPMIII